MGKAKRGQTVKHIGTGVVGVVQSVFRGTARVVLRDGTTITRNTSEFSKTGGCFSVIAISFGFTGGLAYAIQTVL